MNEAWFFPASGSTRRLGASRCSSGRQAEGTVGRAEIAHNLIPRHQKGGVVVDGVSLYDTDDTVIEHNHGLTQNRPGLCKRATTTP